MVGGREEGRDAGNEVDTDWSEGHGSEVIWRREAKTVT